MDQVALYRFRYFDHAPRRFQMSQTFATERAIAHVGGRLLPETERWVPAELVGDNGYLIQGLATATGPYARAEKKTASF